MSKNIPPSLEELVERNEQEIRAARDKQWLAAIEEQIDIERHAGPKGALIRLRNRFVARVEGKP